MKKLTLGILILFVILFAGYIGLMAAFESVITADVSGQVRLDVEEKHLTLPWYLRIGTSEPIRFEGTDKAGQEYTQFVYALSDLFESTEMICIVHWDAARAQLYVGESRGMDRIDQAYPNVIWN